MHDIDLDINLMEISKIEGHAGLEVEIRQGKVKDVRFKIQEYKRFYTQGMSGKKAEILPQFVSRICGTCSNAHLLASTEAIENALGIHITDQAKLLRRLMINGLMIRDHALHLYIFSLPDIFELDSLIDFDETDPLQNQFLHDALEVKAIGNDLQVYIAGRSVHALFIAVGGFTQIPKTDPTSLIKKLESIRSAVIRLINLLIEKQVKLNHPTTYVALRGLNNWSFLDGNIITSRKETIEESKFREHFENVVIPYSQATGYTYQGQSYMVGALSRLNINYDQLHSRTKNDLVNVLSLFPSTDVFMNNVAQAIEMLHCIDDSIDILSNTHFVEEERVKSTQNEGIGIGVIEAPRGLLFYKVSILEGSVVKGQVVVPTGQNQINIEKDIGKLVEDNLETMNQAEIEYEIEKLIRAYDPCISCASHFLKVKWNIK